MIFLLTVLAALASFIGGYAAIRSKDKINLVISLTSGLVLGLVAFDLLPEIFYLAESSKFDLMWPMIALITGFLSFHLIEKSLLLHEGSEKKYESHHHPYLGIARASALIGHSFLDGLSVGLAFQVNNEVGLAVGVAVIGHRFADGFDTTTFMLFHKNSLRSIKKLLSLVIIMPIVGGLASLIINLSPSALAIYLGFFAGFLLYISASNIMPQAHSHESSRLNLLLTILGVAIMFFITRLA